MELPGRSETTLFTHLEGTPLLVCRLLYGAGMRLLEGLTLRVKDIVFQRNEIAVRDDKAGKDRMALLPATTKSSLRQHASCPRHHR